MSGHEWCQVLYRPIEALLDIFGEEVEIFISSDEKLKTLYFCKKCHTSLHEENVAETCSGLILPLRVLDEESLEESFHG